MSGNPDSHPYRPSDVQRRQRGVLVTERFQTSRSAGGLAPPPDVAELGEGVDQADVEQAWWGSRQEPVGEQAGDRGEEQAVARLCIVRPPA